jgi:phospholipid/cholesterol/gamma-HCH transport system permease protein
VVLPLLTIISDFIGLIGGYFIASTMLGLTFSEYWTTAWQALEYNDIAQGLLKPFVFAIIIALVGCFYGMRTTGGTQGVGRATTRAVVSSSVWIFVLTAFITYVWNRVFVKS